MPARQIEANWVEPQDDEANIRWVQDFVADLHLYDPTNLFRLNQNIKPAG